MTAIAAIVTSIEIYDKVSKPINGMIAALRHMCDAFETTERSMDGTFDTASIEQARRKLEQTALEVIELGHNTDRAEKEQEQYNKTVRNGSSAMDGLAGKVGGLIGTYAGIQGVKKVLDLSDALTQTTARLGMLVDGEEEALGLQNQIYEAAQRSRGSYQEMSDAVAKMGMMAGVGDGVDDTFKSTEELVAFTEQLNKQFGIAGTSSEGISSAMLQLTQAMSSGVLRGEELNSVFEQAPTIIQSIADYLNVPIGSIREMAQEGEITADIVKSAMLASAEETNAKFEEMPLTFAQMGTMASSYLLQAFQPVLKRISDIAQSEGFQTFVSGLVIGLTTIVGILLNVIDLVCQAAQLFSDNWTIIEPIVWGIVGALGAYYAIMGLINVVSAIKAGIDGIVATTTAIATAAQHGYNAALAACPLTWIVIAIIAVIAVIAILCQWIAKMTGAASSGFGIICGGINVAIQFFKNLALSVANITLGIGSAIAALGNNILASFWNAICSVQAFFWGLLATVMEVIAGVCKELNKIPFVEIDYSGVSKKANEYAAKQAEANNAKMDYKDIGAAYKEGASTFDTFQDGWVDEAFNAGAEWGDGIADNAGGMFGGFSAGENIFDPGQYSSSYDASQIPSNIDATADNTGAMKDSMEISKEELKYLRDIAERDAINRFTTAEISVNMTNNNNVSSEMDLDGMVDYLVVGVNEAMATAAEGVHA